jgi:hypothetical protein
MDLSVDTVIASLALVVAAGSAIASALIGRRQTRLQAEHVGLANELAQYQLKAHRDAEERDRHAGFRLVLGDAGKRLVLSNIGGAPAENVNLVIRDQRNGRSPISNAGKLPLARLDPSDECSFLVSQAIGGGPPWEYVITWTDSNGEEQSMEKVFHG